MPEYISVTNLISKLNVLKSEYRTDTEQGRKEILNIDLLIEDLKSNPNKDFCEMVEFLGSDYHLKEQLHYVEKEIQKRIKSSLIKYYTIELCNNKELLYTINLQSNDQSPEIIRFIISECPACLLISLDIKLVEQRINKEDYPSIAFFDGDFNYLSDNIFKEGES